MPLRLEVARATPTPLRLRSLTRATEVSKTSGPCSLRISWKSAFFLLPMAQTVSKPGSSSGVPGANRMLRDLRKLSTPSKRGLPST